MAIENILFEEVSKKLSLDDIQELEDQFNVALPDEIKKFYLSHNGGSPTPHLYKIGEEIFSIHQFLPIKYGERDEKVEDVYQSLVIEGKFLPEHLVPIAIDPGGDYYCVSSKEEGKGAIYCFMQDYYDDPSRSIVFLAKNLTELLANLFEEES